MRVLLDTSVLIAAESPGELEGAISAVSLAELHFGVLAAAEEDERGRRSQRLGVVEATFEPLPVDAAVAREWGRLAAAVVGRGGKPRRRALDLVIAATANARAMLSPAEEINFLSGPGRGVILIKIDFPEDKVIGAIVSSGDRDLLTVETSRGSEQTISTTKYEVTGRGGKGRELMQRGGFTKVVPSEVAVPVIEGTGG